MMRVLFLIVCCAAAALNADAAIAQSIELKDIIPNSDASVSGRMIQLIIAVTVLSIAPGLLIMVTCFTRFVIALSFLRTGLGLQTTPANLILVSLALFMTFYVMAPTFDEAWKQGLEPFVENRISEEQAFARTTAPFKAFMRAHVRQKDLDLFAELAEGRITTNTADDPETVELRILIPAFMISELRRGFEIGFLVVLPFLVIDMIVATLTMSMGMMMLPPTVMSLPFKVLFFVLIDGWNLLVGGLLKSFI